MNNKITDSETAYDELLNALTIDFEEEYAEKFIKSLRAFIKDGYKEIIIDYIGIVENE